MVLTKTPICDFGKKAENFQLKSINNKMITLDTIKGLNGTLVMFICNHCPYVKAIIEDLVDDCNNLRNEGINSIAIMSNDTKNYPEDSFENMAKFSQKHKFGNIEYVIDETQEIAKRYGAVCTPDFFGYNKNLELQYRGRIRELKDLKPLRDGDSDLKLAMKLIAKTQKGPLKQIVPEYSKLKNFYTLLWDMKGNEGYINIVAVMQKYFDQAISGNWSYNPENYTDGQVPVSVMAQDLLTTYKLGWKTSYYQNTYDSKKDEDEPSHPIGWQDNVPETNKEEDPENCDSCTI